MAPFSRETRWRLARQASRSRQAMTPPSPARCTLAAPASRQDRAFPDPLRISYPLRLAPLRYGENPHQAAALYRDGSGTGVAGAEQLQGKELSYNNLVDLDAAGSWRRSSTEPAVAIIKHTNPCGAATADPWSRPIQKALATDPVSAFGGVIGVNREVDEAAAEEIAKLFVEAIAAPSFTQGALARFAAKKNLRLVVVKPAARSAGLQAGLRRHAVAG